MTTSIVDFKIVFPEFASLSDASVEFVFECVVDNVSETVFGTCYRRAVYLLVAHNLTMQARGGAVGAITSESVGSLSRSYGGTTSASFLAMSGYGIQYLSLVRLFCGGGSVIC